MRQHNLIPRLRQIEEYQVHPPYVSSVKEYKDTDILLISSRVKANASKRNLHMSGVQSSRTVKLYQLGL